jgi:hypothetical protein
MQQTLDAAMDPKTTPVAGSLHSRNGFTALLSFLLYTKFTLVLGKIFQITGRVDEEVRHEK